MATTPIDDFEDIVKGAVIDIRAQRRLIINELGDRPFGQSRLTPEERLRQYAEMRSQPNGLYDYMENKRLELEEVLSTIPDDERESLGVSQAAIRYTVFVQVLKVVADMLKISARLGIPVIGSEPAPLAPPAPPLPVDSPVEPMTEGVSEWPEAGLMTDSSTLM